MYNIQQLAWVMQITTKLKNLEEIYEIDLSSNFLINRIIWDFTAISMVIFKTFRDGYNHSKVTE